MLEKSRDTWSRIQPFSLELPPDGVLELLKIERHWIVDNHLPVAQKEGVTGAYVSFRLSYYKGKYIHAVDIYHVSVYYMLRLL